MLRNGRGHEIRHEITKPARYSMMTLEDTGSWELKDGILMDLVLGIHFFWVACV